MKGEQKMVSQIFSVLGEIGQGFANLLVDLFGAVVSIFYTAPTGNETTGSLTVVGILALIALGTSLVMWAFRYIKSLIRVRTK